MGGRDSFRVSPVCEERAEIHIEPFFGVPSGAPVAFDEIFVMKHKRPLGVIIFGVILIVTSLDLLRHMPAYAFYAQVNHEWAGPFLKIRFIGSYIFRLLGLACGIGVLCLSEAFRKILVVFAYYCIITLPLRHTYSAQLFFQSRCIVNTARCFLYRPLPGSLLLYAGLLMAYFL